MSGAMNCNSSHFVIVSFTFDASVSPTIQSKIHLLFDKLITREFKIIINGLDLQMKWTKTGTKLFYSTRVPYSNQFIRAATIRFLTQIQKDILGIILKNDFIDLTNTWKIEQLIVDRLQMDGPLFEKVSSCNTSGEKPIQFF